MLNIFSAFIFSLTFFDYWAVGPVRILVVKLLIICLVVLFYGISIKLTPFFVSVILLIAYVSSVSAIGGEFNYAFSVLSFVIIALWPLILNRDNVMRISILRLESVYILVAVLFGFSVIAQYLLHSIFGIIFGVIEFHASRTVYASFWADASFCSLYLASAASICLRTVSLGKLRAILVFVLLAASIITSARTGLVAFIIFEMLSLILLQWRLLIRGKISASAVLIALCLGLVSVIAAFSISIIAGRPISLSSPGRISGYEKALEAFVASPIFGSFFRVEYFVLVTGEPRPHNALLEFATMGGIPFLFLILSVLLLSWAVLFRNSRKYNIMAGIIVTLIGMMFLPSFFSAYYMATLVSILVLERRNRIFSGLHGVAVSDCVERRVYENRAARHN